MNALQQFKQKGRILRKHLANVFNAEVKLAQAYEAVAVMEGCADWNEFSARLVGRASSGKDTPAPAPTQVALPSIRAIFRTVDGKAEAHFDASSWFAQASEDDIEGLMTEKPRMSPAGYELSYGGKNGYSDSIAEFESKTNKDVRDVYTYIGALSDVGGDCGGSDCYIDAHDVHAWRVARSNAVSALVPAPVSAGMQLVLDVQLGAAVHAPLMAKVCALVRQDAEHRHESSDYRPTVQEDIDEALAAFNIVATGEDGAFAAPVYDLMREALARTVSPEQEVVYDTLQIFEVMMQDFVDEYEIPDNVPEWKWVQKNAAFSHRDNGKDGGVWEFMVNVECSESTKDMPDSLKPLFAKARLHRAVWVMFHQGT